MHRLQTLPRGCKPSPAPLAYSCTAALPSSSSRQLAGLPLLFFWASKSDVRHFAPPLNPPRAFKPFPAPLACSCIAALPCFCVRREPGERARGCKPSPAPLAYSCTAALPSSSSRQLAGLPLLFFWASKSDVRHFAPPLNPPRAFKPFPAPLAYSCIAALPCLCVRREPGREPLERASQPCLRQAGAWGESLWNVQPVHCSPSAFGLLLHRNRSLALLSAAGLPSAASG